MKQKYVIVCMQNVSDSPYSGIPSMTVRVRGPFDNKKDAEDWEIIFAPRYTSTTVVPIEAPDADLKKKETKKE